MYIYSSEDEFIRVNFNENSLKTDDKDRKQLSIYESISNNPKERFYYDLAYMVFRLSQLTPNTINELKQSFIDTIVTITSSFITKVNVWLENKDISELLRQLEISFGGDNGRYIRQQTQIAWVDEYKKQLKQS